MTARERFRAILARVTARIDAELSATPSTKELNRGWGRPDQQARGAKKGQRSALEKRRSPGQWVRLLIVGLLLGGCGLPEKAHTRVYPHGGTIVFRTGATTRCDTIVVEQAFIPTRYACYQGPWVQRFRGQDVSTIRVSEPPIRQCANPNVECRP